MSKCSWGKPSFSQDRKLGKVFQKGAREEGADILLMTSRVPENTTQELKALWKGEKQNQGKEYKGPCGERG